MSQNTKVISKGTLASSVLLLWLPRLDGKLTLGVCLGSDAEQTCSLLLCEQAYDFAGMEHIFGVVVKQRNVSSTPDSRVSTEHPITFQRTTSEHQGRVNSYRVEEVSLETNR